MPKPVKGSSRYMPGLDGLRALAVLAVVAYHLNLSFAPGGLLGVAVFFVLSGYLITDLLVAQWRTTGRFYVKDFWLRRARRLFPAMFVMLVAVGAWVVLFDESQLATFRQDALASVLYVSNWWFIFHKVSYFASFGRPSPLGHLWSLAVEEQFYLIWPPILALGLRFLPRRGGLLLLTLAAACASALTMAFLYHPGTDPSRVYYGTDTRAFALLFGAALAVVWPSAKLSAEISIRSRVVLELAGVSALFLVIYTMYTTNEYEAFLYRGGLVLSSVVTAILVATLAHPASVLAKVVGCKPLRWLGVRSYGIYLWHYPVIVLTSPVVNTGGVDVVRDVLQVGASIALAALSWRYVEEPIRRGALAKLWTRKPSFKRRSAIRFGAAACALVVVVTCAAVVEPHDLAATATPSTPVVADAKPVSSSPPANKPTVPKETTLPSQSDQPKQPPTPANTDSPSQSNRHTKEKTGVGVTTIGDSVMVDATPYLEKMLPGIVCDGEVGRQMSQAPAAIAALKAKGELGNRVIIELGTNGPFTKDELVSLLQSLGPVKQIILVNTRVPRPWEAVVNAILAQVAKTFPHTTLVDWYSASAGKQSYFYPDGVHLNPEGAQVYASLLVKAVQS